MPTDLVRQIIRYAVEATGVIVGEMKMTNLNTGQETTFKIDGSIVKEPKPISIDWCDKCEMWKPLEFGRYDGSQGLTMLWFCMECK